MAEVDLRKWYRVIEPTEGKQLGPDDANWLRLREEHEKNLVCFIPYRSAYLVASRIDGPANKPLIWSMEHNFFGTIAYVRLATPRDDLATNDSGTARFEFEADGDQWRITEPTKRELLSIGSDGALVRWARSIDGATQRFRFEAVRGITAEEQQALDRIIGTYPMFTPTHGHIHCLVEAAQPGPFVEAELRVANGRGKLRVLLGWRSSAVCCAEGDEWSFVWRLHKLVSGQVAIYPRDAGDGTPLYASARGDNDWFVQLQAPGFADWVLAIEEYERFDVAAAGVLDVAFRGPNGRYLAIEEAIGSERSREAYPLRSTALGLTASAVFTLENVRPLQTELEAVRACNIEEQHVRWVLKAYGLQMIDADIAAFVQAMPLITPDLIATRISADASSLMLAAHAAGDPYVAEHRGDPGAVVIGALVGAILGAAIGMMIAGPAGAVALGAALSVQGALFGHVAPVNVLEDQRIPFPDVPETQVDLGPAGGPYANRHLAEDLMKLTHFPQIGDAGLPYAGCLLPPDDAGRLQVWMPVQQTIGPFVVDEKIWPPLRLADRTQLHGSLFVIVKLENGKYQLRLHPDEPLLNPPHRPNHSQLTRGSRILGLLGSQQSTVYAAGEIYCTKEGLIRQVTPKTGHYYDWSDKFDDQVLTTTKRMLTALGYDTSGIEFHYGAFRGAERTLLS